MSCAGKPRPLERVTVDRIVIRVFRERSTTLQQEADQLPARRLDASIACLRRRLTAAANDLPEAAYLPRHDPEPGEAGWTAGRLVSHNADRMLWVLGQAGRTLGCGDALRVPAALVANAAEPPLFLSRTESIATLDAADSYVAALLPVLHDADHGQRAGGTHHGELGLSGWLLLLIIHDDDHLGQLRGRGLEGRCV